MSRLVEGATAAGWRGKVLLRHSLFLFVPALALSAACLDLFAVEGEPAAVGSEPQPSAGGAGGGGGAPAPEERCPLGPGELSGSLHFDGDTSLEAEPEGDRFGLVPVWVSAWIQLESEDLTGSFPVFGTRRAGSTRGWSLRIESGSPVLRVAVASGASCPEPCEKVLVGSRKIEQGIWTHVGVALKNELDTTGRLVPAAHVYVDGIGYGSTVLDEAANPLPLPTEWQSFWIGGTGCVDGDCFVGLIDELRVYDEPLDDRLYRRRMLERVEGTALRLRALYRLGDDGAFACDAVGRLAEDTGPSEGNDAAILRDGVGVQGDWRAETPFLPEATLPAPGCSEGAGWELATGIWACKAPARGLPEEGNDLATDGVVAAICAAGYEVCAVPVDRPRLALVPFELAEAPLGCFAFAAIGDACGVCAGTAFTAAVGRACGHRDELGAGCFREGTIDAEHAERAVLAGACVWRGSYSGVLCCSRP